MPDDRTYVDSVIDIVQLARETDPDVYVLDGFTFERCIVRGPAVLLIVRDVRLSRCTIPGSIEGISWEVLPARTEIVGAIPLLNTVFNECTFEGVGLAGRPDAMRTLRNDLTGKN